jgi:hypothetical protein
MQEYTHGATYYRSELEKQVHDAMYHADRFGRKFYRGLIQISRVEDEKQDALRRLRSSRSAIVRDSANRLVNHDRNFVWYRYLTQASMSHIELVAQHPTMRDRSMEVAR